MMQGWHVSSHGTGLGMGAVLQHFGGLLGEGLCLHYTGNWETPHWRACQGAVTCRRTLELSCAWNTAPPLDFLRHVTQLS